MQCYGGGSTREPTCECLLPAGAVATPGSRYCTFQCAAGYVSDPQASFDPIARVGTVLSIVNDTQGPQVLNFTAAMKQALPVGRQHIFFVSRANELWLSTFNTTAGAWGLPEALLTDDMTYNKGGTIDMRLIPHEPFDLSIAGLAGVWLLWTFNSTDTCGAAEYNTKMNGGAYRTYAAPCTWLVRWVIPTLAQKQQYFTGLNSYFRIMYPPGGFPVSAGVCAVDPGGWEGTDFGTFGAPLSGSIAAAASLTRLTTPSGASSYEYVIWAGEGGLYQYQAVFAGGTSRRDTVVRIASAPDVNAMAFGLSALYATVAGSNTLVWWPVTAAGGLASGASPVATNVSAVVSVYPTVAADGVQLGSLFLLGAVMLDGGGRAHLAHVDLLNRYAWPSVALPSGATDGVLQLAGTTVFLLDGGNAAWLPSPPAQPLLCGVDMVSYNGAPCAPVHCRLATPGGANSGRVFGSVSVGCNPGYSLDGSGTCVLCPRNAYCTGGGAAPTLCPSPSTVTLSTGSTSSAACVCKAGYYTFPGNPQPPQKWLFSCNVGIP